MWLRAIDRRAIAIDDHKWIEGQDVSVFSLDTRPDAGVRNLQECIFATQHLHPTVGISNEVGGHRGLRDTDSLLFMPARWLRYDQLQTPLTPRATRCSVVVAF